MSKKTSPIPVPLKSLANQRKKPTKVKLIEEKVDLPDFSPPEHINNAIVDYFDVDKKKYDRRKVRKVILIKPFLRSDLEEAKNEARIFMVRFGVGTTIRKFNKGNIKQVLLYATPKPLSNKIKKIGSEKYDTKELNLQISKLRDQISREEEEIRKLRKQITQKMRLSDEAISILLRLKDIKKANKKDIMNVLELEQTEFNKAVSELKLHSAKPVTISKTLIKIQPSGLRALELIDLEATTIKKIEKDIQLKRKKLNDLELKREIEKRKIKTKIRGKERFDLTAQDLFSLSRSSSEIGIFTDEARNYVKALEEQKKVIEQTSRAIRNLLIDLAQQQVTVRNKGNDLLIRVSEDPDQVKVVQDIQKKLVENETARVGKEIDVALGSLIPSILQLRGISKRK